MDLKKEHEKLHSHFNIKEEIEAELELKTYGNRMGTIELCQDDDSSSEEEDEQEFQENKNKIHGSQNVQNKEHLKTAFIEEVIIEPPDIKPDINIDYNNDLDIDPLALKPTTKDSLYLIENIPFLHELNSSAILHSKVVKFAYHIDFYQSVLTLAMKSC